MDARTARSLALVVFGIAGLAGQWPSLPLWLVVAGIAWLPGSTLAARVTPRLGQPNAIVFGGPGALALDFALSLALIVPILAPFFVAGAPFGTARACYAAMLIVIGLTCVLRRAPHAVPTDEQRSLDWIVAAVAVATLLPVVLSYAGATVDDWWDLSFIRGYVEATSLSFAEPILGSGRLHPRFLWSSWYVVQALVLEGRMSEAVAMQAGPLAGFVCIMVVSAHALLARVIFVDDAPFVRRAAVLCVPAWLYGTEALPFFTRLHQDKFVTGLVLVPVLLAVVYAGLRAGGARIAALLVFAVAVAACSTHSLVFGVGLIGVATLVLVEIVVGGSRSRARLGIAAAALPALLYPIGQAVALRERFHAQGIALEFPDNPVVLAHLSLDRLLWPLTDWYVVNPVAVFGPIAAVGFAGLLLSLRGPRNSAAAVIAGLTAVPMLLIFVPGMARLVGGLIVPWMVYRVGWLVPVPLLVAMVVRAAHSRRGSGRRQSEVRPAFDFGRAARVALVVVTVLLAVVPVALDRLRRDMREHPVERERGPRGTTKHLYDFLATLPADSLVVAQPGVSRLLPSLTGRATLAMGERATLVFSTDELSAYRRLRARSDFYGARADGDLRRRLADEFGITHAVFRRRWITAGSEARWFRGSAGPGFALLATAPDRRTAYFNSDIALEALPGGTRVIFENDDFFVAAISTGSRGVSSTRGSRDGDWTTAFDLTPVANSNEAEPVLASAVRYPGARVAFHPVPVALGSTVFPVWTGGGELWEDVPSEVRAVLTMSSRCALGAVEVVPYLPTGRREVLEITIDDRRSRMLAHHKEPLVIAVDGGLRKTVFVRVRSMVGASFGLADIRLRGDPSSCDREWQPIGEPVWSQAERSIIPAMRVAQAYPYRGASAVALAEVLNESERPGDALAVLRSVVPTLAGETVPWIEFGLLEDARGGFREALGAFETAVSYDSNSAWARGCLAWADLRRGAFARAIWHSWQALRLEQDYADAYTILAGAAKKLGLRGVAGRLLDRAIASDRYRSWGYIEMARMLDEGGERGDAIQLLEEFLKLVPFDPDARTVLDNFLSSTAG